jgi:hypothetical protein
VRRALLGNPGAGWLCLAGSHRAKATAVVSTGGSRFD